MEEQKDDVFELDILQLLRWLRENALLIVLVAAVFGLATFGYTYFRVTPRYDASTTLYVNSSSFTIGSNSFSLSGSELSTSKGLVETYLFVLESRTTLERVIEEADLNLSPSALMRMISAEQVSGTAAFTIHVSSPSPTQAELIANTIAKVLPERIAEIIYGTSVQVVDYAIVPSSSSYPNYTKSTLLGAAIGFALSAVCVVGWCLLRDIKAGVVGSSGDLRKMFSDIPVFAVIPDIRYHSGKGYYNYNYYYSSKNAKEEKDEAKKA